MANLPDLGSKAPDFTANSTNGKISLSDFNQKWVVLFSHPGVFSPVCTTEFLEFTKYYDEFTSRNTELIAINNDSNSAHLAWMYNIFNLTGVEIPFPIIEDKDMRISRTYGMLAKPMESCTVRSVFIIDNNQVLRSILYYPITTGRNIPEILRLVDALQTSDDDDVMTPASWFPGCPVILPHPKKYKDLKNSIKDCSKKYSQMDWYLCFVPDKGKESSKKSNSYKEKFFDSKPMIPEEDKKDKKDCECINSMNDEEIDKNVEDFYNEKYLEHDYSKNKNIKTIAKQTINNHSNKKSANRPQISDLYNVINEELDCPDLDRIVMQYVFGNPTNLDAQLLDAAIYAFVEINPDGTLLVPTPNFLRQMVNLKAEKPSLKIIAAIGGWGADGFSDAALTPTSRYNFAREVNALINEYNLDGIDIDWEYPGTGAAGIVARPVDRENFTLLLTAIRDVIGDDMWLSVAGTGDAAYVRNSADIAAIAPIIDYFNLMSYDFTAGESGPNAKKHHANLYDSPLSLPGYSVDRMVDNLINAGMPPEKILLGVPFYGRLGSSLTRSYDQLRRDYINKNGFQYRFDQEALVPYLTQNGDFAMSFDDALSIFLKAQYVMTRCLGGIFSWTSTYDQANILGRTLYQSIYDPDALREELEGVYGIFT